MITAIKKFFNEHISVAVAGSYTGTQPENVLHLATAALLIEMARADFDVKDEELLMVADSVKEIFGLAHDEAVELVALAEQEANEATCHYEFTALINKGFQPKDKVKIVELMWQVAYADNKLQKYEEALVRKIADLIYVPHKDFIAAKHRVLDRQIR